MVNLPPAGRYRRLTGAYWEARPSTTTVFPADIAVTFSSAPPMMCEFSSLEMSIGVADLANYRDSPGPAAIACNGIHHKKISAMEGATFNLPVYSLAASR
jgi:hypothetical protein